MKKYSLVHLDIDKSSSRISTHPSTWDYVVCSPELSTKRDVYQKLEQLTKNYGPPIDSVGTIRRHFDAKTNTSYMFAIIVDSTNEVFKYSQNEADKFKKS